MKKVKHRTLAAFLVVALMLVCFVIFAVKYIAHGGEWASFQGNQSVYTNSVLAVGSIYDRNGVMLSTVSDGYRIYSDDELTRVSTLHAVGDPYGNIGTGALSAFREELIGYNIISGTYSVMGKGMDLYLSIDSRLNEAAYNALDGRAGAVGVFNYETGEIVCMVSSKSYDPTTEIDPDDESNNGVYVNKFISSTFTPGSTFKLVTLAAAIENIPDLYDRTFTCTGSYEIGGDEITCTSVHGDMTIEDALANSCNGVFAQLALELGADTMNKYFEKFGLNSGLDINGITTAAGNYSKGDEGSVDLAWSGAGQYEDLVNPAAMMRYVGAIANGGKTVEPKLISSLKYSSGITAKGYRSVSSKQILSESTAEKIGSMMSYNTYKTYGQDNFPGLDLCAKSGTAEVGEGQSPHAWFTGYITNEDYPLAFVVIIENGGWGSSEAGAVANKVLQAAVNDEDQ